MKKFARMLTVLLALCVALSAVSLSAYAEEAQSYYPKYEEPITISTHAVISTNRPYQDGDSPESNGFTRWCEDVLNIKWELKWTTSDGATDSQKLDLAFASDDLPDVISPTIAQLSKYAASGKIVAMDDLTTQYGSPLLDWVLDDAVASTQGAFYLPFTSNGHVYAMPGMSDTLAYWTVNFVRSDLLAELGMEAPTTLVEMEALFDAYLAKYPNSYPLAIDKDITDSDTGFRTVMSAYNAYLDQWIKGEDGSLAYSSIQPEMRAALEKMAEWYQKGYINPEFVIVDSAKLSETVSAGDFIVYHGYWWSIGNPFGNMWINLPESEVETMPYVSGDAEGTGKIMKSSWFTGSRAITSSCEHPEALVYLFNLQLESLYRNEPLAIEACEKAGYTMHYPYTEIREPLNEAEVAEKYPNVAEPKYLWDYDYPAELVGPKFFNDFYTDYGEYGLVGKPVSIGNYAYDTLSQAVKTGDMSVLTATAQETYNGWYGSNPKMLTTFATIYDYWKDLAFEVNSFAGANTDTMIEKQTYLDKLELETFTRIIMGSSPIEAFDEFVEQWKANGGEQITEEVNAWYAASK